MLIKFDFKVMIFFLIEHLEIRKLSFGNIIFNIFVAEYGNHSKSMQ